MRKHGWFRPHVRGLTAISSTTLREGGGWWLAGSQLDLDFARDRSFNRKTGYNATPNGLLTYTSPSSKMVFGADGVLGYAPHNFLVRSQTFDNASWSKPQATVTADAAIAPDGTTTADALLDTAVSNIHYAGQSIAALSPAGRTYTFSVSLKASTLNYATVGLSDISSGTLFAVAVFNLSNGTVSTSGASGTGYAVVSSSITGEGNGWYRCVVTATAGTSASFLTAVIGLNKTGVISGAAGGFESYLGNGSGVLVWGAQVSLGYEDFDYRVTTTAAVYSLPIDHDPITFNPLGVLIEEQRTNLLTYSEQFDNAAWTKTDVTITANAEVAPNGTTTADLATEGSAGTSIILLGGITVTVGSPLTQSIYVKRGNTDWFFMQIAGLGSERLRGWYNLSTLATSTTVALPGSGASATITDVGNGWLRCTLTGTLNGAGPTATAYYTSVDADGSLTRVSGATKYLWGAQLEAGAFPTSYIPTVASQVTRAADQVSILTSAFAYNSAEGTCVSEQDANFDVAAFVRVPAILTDGGSNYIRPYLYPNRGGLSIITGGVSQCDVGGGGEALTTGVAFKLATAWATNDVAKVVNGLTVGTDTSVSIPTGITSLRIGSSGNNVNVVSGHIKRLTYFPTRKTNAELQALSA